MVPLLPLFFTAALGQDENVPAPAPVFPPSVICTGTEPFWSVVVKDGTASAATPDRPTAPTVAISVTATAHGDAFLVTPKGKGAGFRWLTLRAGACTDDASGAVHPYSALALSAEAGFVTGCCRKSG